VNLSSIISIIFQACFLLCNIQGVKYLGKADIFPCVLSKFEDYNKKTAKCGAIIFNNKEEVKFIYFKHRLFELHNFFLILIFFSFFSGSTCSTGDMWKIGFS
jgi:hypothetical protein